MDDRDSDFYNVTVNMVVRRIPKYEADLKAKQEASKQPESSLLQVQAKDDNTLRASYVNLAQTQTELELQKHHKKHHSHRHSDNDDLPSNENKPEADKVDDEFNKIQEEDMKQEQQTDQKGQKLEDEDSEENKRFNDAERSAKNLEHSL